MGWLKDIKRVPQKIKYSQNGEEYWLKYIFDHLGTTNKHLVDLGAWDGTHLSNTRLLRELGWTAFLVDGKDFPDVYKAFITKENILEILEAGKTPEEFDLLSIDLDGNDYWILDKLLTKYKPRVIVSEYNSEHPVTDCKTIEYNPNFIFQAPEDYYGYTYGAGLKLADKHGYTIVWQNSNLNLYYLRNDLLPETPDYNIVQYRHWGKATDKTWVHV